MSGREWQPGDVAMVFADVCVRCEDGWEHGDPRRFKHPPKSPARRLAVIDPEDRAQAERLELALREASGWSSYLADQRTDALGRALREFAQPQPVKPEEPTGLGAVIEDASGEKWVRIHQGTLAPWRGTRRPDESRPVRYFKDIDVVRVLSEGIS